MAESLIRDLDKKLNPEIHLFSDGAVPELAEFENKALPLIYHKVGSRATISASPHSTPASANPEDATQRAVYVSVANVSSNSMSADLELLLDGQLVNTVSLTVPGQQTAPQVFQSHAGKGRRVHRPPQQQDDLAADNEASIVSLLPKPVNVLLVTRAIGCSKSPARRGECEPRHRANDLTDGGAGLISSCSMASRPLRGRRAMCSRSALAARTGSRTSPTWKPPVIVD